MTGQCGKAALCAAAAADIHAAQPAQAAMGCWNDNQVAAAQGPRPAVAADGGDAALPGDGLDVLPAYNRFVRANRATIQGANGVIMAQFRAGHGARRPRPNMTGSQPRSPISTAPTRPIARSAATRRRSPRRRRMRGGDIRIVCSTIADRFGIAPALPGGQCGISFASLQRGRTMSHI